LLEVLQGPEAWWEASRESILVNEQRFEVAKVTDALGDFTLELVFRKVQATQCLIWLSNGRRNWSSELVRAEKENFYRKERRVS